MIHGDPFTIDANTVNVAPTEEGFVPSTKSAPDVNYERPSRNDVRTIEISEIAIGKGHRALDLRKVQDIADSICDIGLMTPITVMLRCREGKARLVAGLHRLEAAKLLGKQYIDCVVIPDDERDARLWQLAENLHRAELKILERAELLAKYVKLIEEKRGALPPSEQRRAGRPEGAVVQAARELRGLAKSESARRKCLERALRVNQMCPEAKDMARMLGLDDNRSALERIAREATRGLQVRKAEELASRRRNTVEKKNVKGGSSEDMMAALRTAWDQAIRLNDLWAKTPKRIRRQFIAELLKRPDSR
jgi:ParB-like chromosome segregation protein Spo0J